MGRGAVVAFNEVREREAELAEEQAALRRVATLVAGGAPPEDVFAAVAREVSHVLALPLVEMCRYEPDETATVIGAIGDHPFQTGTRWPLDGESLTGIVWRTGLILARVREEIAGGSTARDAAAIALRTAGPSVLHAGLVLAGSFAVLVVDPALGQIGFAIAVGILLSSLLTARVLIPALTVLIGRRAWWPSQLVHRKARRPSAAPAPELAK